MGCLIAIEEYIAKPPMDSLVSTTNSNASTFGGVSGLVSSFSFYRKPRWMSGVLLGSSSSSETEGAQAGQVLMRGPHAMVTGKF